MLILKIEEQFPLSFTYPLFAFLDQNLYNGWIRGIPNGLNHFVITCTFINNLYTDDTTSILLPANKHSQK